MNREQQPTEAPPAPGPGGERVPDNSRRETLFIFLGFTAIALIVAFAGQAPGGTSAPWDSATTAAGKGAPAAMAEVARALDALRANVVAWRLVTLILVGGTAGLIANRIIPGQRAGGPAAVLIGVFGSALGGYVCQHFGYSVETGVSLASVGVAFAGAAGTLVAARFVGGM